MTHPSECPYCAIAEAKQYEDSINGEMCVFRPLNAFAPGHLIVATIAHVQDPLTSPPLTGRLAGYAALTVRKRNYKSASILAGVGAAQGAWAVQHLHFHIIPGETLIPLVFDPEKVEEEDRPAPRPPAPKPNPPRKRERGTLRSLADTEE